MGGERDAGFGRRKDENKRKKRKKERRKENEERRKERKERRGKGGWPAITGGHRRRPELAGEGGQGSKPKSSSGVQV